MRNLDKYYQKIYKETDRLLKRMFGLDVHEGMKKTYELKKDIEVKINKPICDITKDDLVEFRLSIQYCEYRTLSKILEVLSGACFLKTFTDDEIRSVWYERCERG